MTEVTTPPPPALLMAVLNQLDLGEHGHFHVLSDWLDPSHQHVSKVVPAHWRGLVGLTWGTGINSPFSFIPCQILTIG